MDEYGNDPGFQLTPLGRRVGAILLAIGILLLLTWALSAEGASAETTTPEWHYIASATSICQPSKLTSVTWSFKNTDSRPMQVAVGALGWPFLAETFQVAPGKTIAGSYTKAAPLAAGSVQFDMTWSDGGPGGTDRATRSYAEIKTCAVTAIGLQSFSAAPMPGNQGGCGIRNRNMRYGVTCNVSDAGPGFVSGKCNDGYWFSRIQTRRSFTIDQIVTVDGCEGLNQELYAPIRISK